ncbi:MAG: hypothetical protein ACE5IF_03600 [Candidatus Bathyarchaeia archaeon]
MSKSEQKIMIGLDLAPHKVGAITATVAPHPHLQGKAKKIGNQEGYIVVPIKTDWRTLKL